MRSTDDGAQRNALAQIATRAPQDALEDLRSRSGGLSGAHLAADLASRYGAEVLVLHVLEQDYLYGVAVDREASEQASECVDRHVRRMKDSGLNARGDVTPALRGHAAHAILTMANDESADLIVIGTSGASMWGRLFGNVTEKVLRFARGPVLVVR